MDDGNSHEESYLAAHTTQSMRGHLMAASWVATLRKNQYGPNHRRTQKALNEVALIKRMIELKSDEERK